MIKAVDLLEAEKADFVACVRIADIPPLNASNPLYAFHRIVRARSIVQQCCDCGEDIIVDHENVPRTPRRICLPCVFLRTDAPEGLQ